MKANLVPTNRDSSSRKIIVEVFKASNLIHHFPRDQSLYQIAVNYAQVTAVAISINVSWDLNLVRLFEAAGKRQATSATI